MTESDDVSKSLAPLRVVLPLTSFANTPQNISMISFVLGLVFSSGLSLALGFGHVSDPNLYLNGFARALMNPYLGLYLASWSLFHLLEYVVTATWNPLKVKVDC